MSNARAGLFEADDDLDVSGFAPKKPEPGAKPAAAEEVRAVSEASSFRSREPAARKSGPGRYGPSASRASTAPAATSSSTLRPGKRRSIRSTRFRTRRAGCWARPSSARSRRSSASLARQK